MWPFGRCLSIDIAQCFRAANEEALQRRMCSHCAECVRTAAIAIASSVALSLACICALSFTLRLGFSASGRPRRGSPRAAAGAAGVARRFDCSALRGEVGAGGARLAQCCGRAPKAHAAGWSWGNVSNICISKLSDQKATKKIAA